jgi:AraC-type DNA-binding domain-containing proteins
MFDLMNLNPILLRVNRFEGYSMGEIKNTPPRHVYDFEMEYIERCDGCMRIDNTFVRFAPGDICIRKPGMFTYGIMPYQSILVCADLFGDTSKCAGYVLGDNSHTQVIDDIKIISNLPVKIPAAVCIYAGRLITSLLETSSYATDYHRMRVKSLLLQVICELCAVTVRPLVSDDRFDSSFTAVLAYIDERLETELRVSELVGLSGVSRATFFRLFEARTGFSPAAYIERRRLERARGLLELGSPGLSVQTVAERCGYLDAAYFCRVFREYTGITPAKYREAAGRLVESALAAQT